MTDEQVQTAIERLDTRLADILALLQQIVDDMRKETAELKDEINAINALPHEFQVQRGLPSDATREYLSGRWKRRDGDGYFQPPLPPPEPAHVNDPSGPVRPPGVSRD